MVNLTHRFKRAIRYWWQRRTRGWDDEETWNLDNTFAKFMIPRLKRYKEISQCFPNGFTPEEWDKTVQKMIDGLEWKVKNWYDTPDADWKEDYKHYREALELLFKHFDEFWW